MGRVVLIEAWPRRPSDGATVPFRVIGGAPIRADYFGVQWLPALATLPRFETRLGFDGRVFGAGAVNSVGDISVALGSTALDAYLEYLWANAAVTIKEGNTDDADGAFVTTWTGRAATAKAANKRMIITLADPAEELRRPALTSRYAGSGDLEGPADLKGALKYKGWGFCENVPTRLIDPAYNIWQAHDGAVTFGTIRDGGVAFSSVTNVADLAALRAAVIAAGAVVTCNALGLIRPWTAPKYKLTADITVGSATTAADIAQAIVTSRSTLTFASGTVAAFNALNSAAISEFVDDERTVAEVLDRIFIGAWWKLNSSGQIELGRWEFGTPVQTFEAEVADIARLDILTPTYRRQVGYRRNNAPLSDGEIAAAILSGDISGLGALAVQNSVDWASQVAGTGKPENNAQVNPADTNNLIRNTAFAGGSTTGWTTNETVTLAYDISALTNAPTKYGIRYAAAGNNGHTYPLGSNVATAGTDAVPVAAGEKLYMEGWGYRDGSANGHISLYVRWYDKTGAHLSYSEVVLLNSTTVPSTNTFTKVSGTVTAPANAAYAYVLWSNRTDHTTGTWCGALAKISRYQPGADITSENASADTTNVSGVPAKQILLSQTEIFETFANYTGVSEIPWTISGSANVSLVTTTDSGGKALRCGNNSGNDEVTAICNQALDFTPEDLWMAEVDIEVEFSSSGFMYFGVKAEDNAGANLTSHNGTYHYQAGSGEAMNFTGRKKYVGYIRGHVGADTNSGYRAATPNDPKPLANNTVRMKPLFIANYNGQAGQVLIHSFRLRKIVDATPNYRGAWSSSVTYYKDDAVDYQGRRFMALVKHTNTTPPTSETSTSTWLYLGLQPATALATRNDFYRQSSDPGAVPDGTFWYNTSTSILYQRVSGAWQTVGTGYTNTNQLTDGANLGGTAAWSGVSGSGKPEDYSTRNDIYNQTSDPGAVANGSYWYSSSTKLMKRREGGAWVTVASYNVGALADKNTVGNGDVDDGAITTPKVQDGAGAIVAAAYTSGTVSTSSDSVWSVAQQVTVTNSTAEIISINFTFHAINLGGGWTKNSVRVRRNLGGVDTYVWGGSAGKPFIIDNDGMAVSGGCTDTVAAGDDPTYYVEFKKYTGYTGSTLSVSERHMVAIEDKFA